MGKYSLDGLPSDLLASKSGANLALRVAKDVGSPNSKVFTYNDLGLVGTVTTTDTLTGKVVKITLEYDELLRVSSITTEEL